MTVVVGAAFFATVSILVDLLRGHLVTRAVANAARDWLVLLSALVVQVIHGATFKTIVI